MNVNSEIFARILFSRIALKDMPICVVENSQLWHDLATSVNDRVISPFREGFISRNFAMAKFCENKPSQKFEFLHLRSYLVHSPKIREYGMI